MEFQLEYLYKGITYFMFPAAKPWTLPLISTGLTAISVGLLVVAIAFRQKKKFARVAIASSCVVALLMPILFIIVGYIAVGQPGGSIVQG